MMRQLLILVEAVMECAKSVAHSVSCAVSVLSPCDLLEMEEQILFAYLSQLMAMQQ